MFVVETISIDVDEIAKTISLDDLISLRSPKFLGYGFSSIVCNLIIMKKLSDYLKQHPQTNLYTLSLSDLIYKIKEMCLNLFDNNSFDNSIYEEYKLFMKKFNDQPDVDECRVLFHADKAIKILEMRLI